MTFFTSDEFEDKYSEYSLYNGDYEEWQIEAVSEMIFSQIGLMFRDSSWDDTNVPSAIKNASMEQLRFMIEHSIPFIDYNGKVEAGTYTVKVEITELPEGCTYIGEATIQIVLTKK